MQSSQGLRTFSKIWYQSRSMHLFDVLLKKRTAQLSLACNSYFIYIPVIFTIYIYIFFDIIVTVIVTVKILLPSSVYYCKNLNCFCCMTFFATQSDQQHIKRTVGKCGVTSYPTQSLSKHLLHQCQFQIQFFLHLRRLSHRQSHSHHHTSHLSQYRCYVKRTMQQQFSLTLIFSL